MTSAHDDFTEKNRFCTYINSNWNRFSEWPLMSGIEISSSQGLKKPPKMSPREEKAYLPRAAGPQEVSFFFPRAYFKVFYNPRDEEISIPDINGHSENLFLLEFISVRDLFRSVRSSCARVTRGEMVISAQARILPGEKLPFPPG